MKLCLPHSVIWDSLTLLKFCPQLLYADPKDLFGSATQDGVWNSNSGSFSRDPLEGGAAWGRRLGGVSEAEAFAGAAQSAPGPVAEGCDPTERRRWCLWQGSRGVSGPSPDPSERWTSPWSPSRSLEATPTRQWTANGQPRPVAEGLEGEGTESEIVSQSSFASQRSWSGVEHVRSGLEREEPQYFGPLSSNLVRVSSMTMQRPVDDLASDDLDGHSPLKANSLRVRSMSLGSESSRIPRAEGLPAGLGGEPLAYAPAEMPAGHEADTRSKLKEEISFGESLKTGKLL